MVFHLILSADIIPMKQTQLSHLDLKWRWQLLVSAHIRREHLIKIYMRNVFTDNGHVQIRVHQMRRNDPLSKGNKKWKEKKKKSEKFTPCAEHTVFGFVFFKAYTYFPVIYFRNKTSWNIRHAIVT